MSNLPSAAVNFLLFWFKLMIENCGHVCGPDEVHANLIHRANEVITAHNMAVFRGRRFIPDAHFSDNQCVFSTFLRHTEVYVPLKTSPN